jgi:hypothetical protein
MPGTWSAADRVAAEFALERPWQIGVLVLVQGGRRHQETGPAEAALEALASRNFRWTGWSSPCRAPMVPRWWRCCGLAGLPDQGLYRVLLAGVPAEVRIACSRTVLGEPRGNAALLETLETFLARDGSWERTAEALHLNDNSVHYRIGRIEHSTGRDLCRLYDRPDLWAALLCRTDSA